MDRIKPQSPDPFIIEDEDMYLIRLGHLNAVIDALNTMIPSGGVGIMYQSQYDPFGTGVVTNSFQLNGQGPAYYLNRANHTGTQSQSTITNLVADLAAKGDMFKLVYDPDNDGVVVDSALLNAFPGSYYLDRLNHTGVQAQATVTNLVADLAAKELIANKGAANGYAPLVGGLIPLAFLPPGTPNLYLGLYDASTNTPAILNGVGTAGEFYIASVTGNAYAPVNVTLVNQIVAYNGAIWEVGAVFSPGITDVNGQTGPTVLLDLDDIANTLTRAAVAPDHASALATSLFPLSATNPVASAQEINNLVLTIATKGDMFKATYDTDNDGIVDNSERLGNQLPSYYLDRANHTGTQPQTSITNLLVDLALKEDKINKGVPNGYCDLDAGGKVPLARLNLTAFNYQNSWNAFTNVPFISDGVGTAGDTYIVGVAGTRNLGSGSISFAVGDLVVYNGTIWQKISAPAMVLVNSVNGQTGAVVLDLDDIADTATRSAVSPDEAAGLAASPNPVTALNPVATQADLTALLAITSDFVTPERFGNNETLGDGNLRTLASLGYTNLTAANAWPRVDAEYGMDVNTMSIDFAAWQEMELFRRDTGATGMICNGSRKSYCFNQSVLLPKSLVAVSQYTRSRTITYNFNGANFRNLTNGPLIMFDRYPVDHTEAAGEMLQYGFTFRDGTFVGTTAFPIAGEAAIRLAATGHSTIENCSFRSFDTCFILEFCLEVNVKNVWCGFFGEYGAYIGDGRYTGATPNQDQSNNVIIDQFHTTNGSGYFPTACLFINGNRNVNGRVFTFEGSAVGNPQFCILYDDNGATTVKNILNLSDLDFEQAGASVAGVRFKAGSGQCIIRGFNNQVPAVDMPVLFEAMGGSNRLSMNIERAAHNHVIGWKFRNNTTGGSGAAWTVNDVTLPNPLDLYDPAHWDTSLPAYTIPSPLKVRFWPRLDSLTYPEQHYQFWNAATNYPELADPPTVGGVAGMAYIVGVAGTINLGAGAQTFERGDMIIHTGSRWLKFQNYNMWNVTANLPALSDATGVLGQGYTVGVGGTRDLGSGNITFAVGDMAIHNGTVWVKIVN